MTESHEHTTQEVHPCFGAELRRLRSLAGLSLGQLAQKIHYSKGHLSKIERGAKQPPPQLARLCDAALGANGRLASLSSSSADPPRRKVVTVGAASVLLSSLPGNQTAPAASKEEGVSLAFFRSLFDQFRRIGQVAGPHAVLPALTAQTHTLTGIASKAGDPVRTQLLLLASRYAEFAGWMAQEGGDDVSAMKWTDEAASLASSGGDHDLTHYAVLRRALVTMYAGDADGTITLARAAQDKNTSYRIRGLAAVQEAQGHALAGQEVLCRRALDRSRDLLDRATKGDAAPVLGTSHVSDPTAMAEGWCLYDLGRPAEAAARLGRELNRLPADAMRARARYGMRQALAHATAGDIDEACAVADSLLRSVDVVSSATIRTDLYRLNSELNRFRTHSVVRELSPRMAASLRPAV
ncbi:MULTISPECIES: helix-turn-helix domain-containing protein [Streptomyces]|uniref:helix-turn-helix domain-containing protein n=1 Tax=Streptomyces TaxID=1883 RepID=UPI00062894E4|nr:MULTISPECIES: helix-turn-helix transcriptional regulator [Streptomyces]